MLEDYIPYIKQIMQDNFGDCSSLNHSEWKAVLKQVYQLMPGRVKMIASESAFIQFCSANKETIVC